VNVSNRSQNEISKALTIAVTSMAKNNNLVGSFIDFSEERECRKKSLNIQQCDYQRMLKPRNTKTPQEIQENHGGTRGHRAHRGRNLVFFGNHGDEVLVFIGFIIKVNTPTAKVFQSKTSTSVTISRICPGAHSEKEVAGHQLNDATTLI